MRIYRNRNDDEDHGGLDDIGKEEDGRGREIHHCQMNHLSHCDPLPSLSFQPGSVDYRVPVKSEEEHSGGREGGSGWRQRFRFVRGALVLPHDLLPRFHLAQLK